MSAPPDNVVTFRARPLSAIYAPGVTPFDPGNPVHIAAWNMIHQFGWAAQRTAQARPELEIIK